MKSEEQTLALTPSEPMPVGKHDPEALLRFAVEHKADVETIERLMNVRRELKAEQAKAAYDEAMSAFQSECPIIIKEKGVPDRSGRTAYKYAPIESIEVQIRPLLRRYGFSHTFDTDTASEAGWVIAKCLVKHRDGHSEVSTAKFPLGTKTQIMSDTQCYAAALTFANRRALCNAYGLILAGEDMDGRTGKIKPAGPSALATESDVKPLARELWALLKDRKIIKGDEKNWNAANNWLFSEDILDGGNPDDACPHLSPDRFREVIKAAKEKLK